MKTKINKNIIIIMVNISMPSTQAKTIAQDTIMTILQQRYKNPMLNSHELTGP